MQAIMTYENVPLPDGCGVTSDVRDIPVGVVDSDEYEFLLIAQWAAERATPAQRAAIRDLRGRGLHPEAARIAIVRIMTEGL